MGINLVWLCDEHRKRHTSMRGEEGIDFQAMVREFAADECPRLCLSRGTMRVQHDGYAAEPYDEIWPTWETRPGERRKAGA